MATIVKKKAPKPPAQKAEPADNPSILQDEKSTRELILERSLRLINEGGMVDFRIEALVNALSLSPGNITYHFSRKEDICVALWERYLEEYGNVVHSITSLLDLKQLYLLNRINIYLNYKYRGVVIFRNADLGATIRDLEEGRVNQDQHFAISEQITEMLASNAYLKEGLPLYVHRAMHTYYYIVMRWGLNFGYESWKPSEVEAKLDYLALLSVHGLYPILNEKGRREFAEITRVVTNNDLRGSDDMGVYHPNSKPIVRA